MFFKDLPVENPSAEPMPSRDSLGEERPQILCMSQERPSCATGTNSAASRRLISLLHCVSIVGWRAPSMVVAQGPRGMEALR